MCAASTFELKAELRQNHGKAHNRRLRRLDEKVPGIVYGGGKAPTTIMLVHKKMMHFLENESVFSHLLKLQIGQDQEQVILKDLHRHHYKNALLHVDFLRVKSSDKITLRVPLHFINGQSSPGVKAGGNISHRMNDVEVQCRADSIPEFLEVDLGEVALDHIVHLSDLKLPQGVEIVELSHGPEHNHAVASIQLPKAVQETTSPSESTPAATEVKKPSE